MTSSNHHFIFEDTIKSVTQKMVEVCHRLDFQQNFKLANLTTFEITQLITNLTENIARKKHL